jgi:hypothetical protein
MSFALNHIILSVSYKNSFFDFNKRGLILSIGSLLLSIPKILFIFGGNKSSVN